MSKKTPQASSPAKSPAKTAPAPAELNEKELDQASGGLIYNDKPYIPRRP